MMSDDNDDNDDNDDDNYLVDEGGPQSPEHGVVDLAVQSLLLRLQVPAVCK